MLWSSQVQSPLRQCIFGGSLYSIPRNAPYLQTTVLTAIFIDFVFVFWASIIYRAKHLPCVPGFPEAQNAYYQPLQPIPSPYPQHLFELSVSHTEPLFPCPKSSRYQTAGDHLCSPEPANIIQSYAIPPAPCCLFHRKHRKGSGPCLPLDPASASWATLVLPCVALCDMTCPLLLETVSNKNLLSTQLESVLSSSHLYKPRPGHISTLPTSFLSVRRISW